MQITSAPIAQEAPSSKKPTLNASQKTTETTIVSATNIEAESSTKVTLSGRAIMIARLFGNEEPPIEYGTDTALDYKGKGMMAFLQSQDRDLLADIYDYAQRKGIAFEHIDILATELAYYRSHDSGKGLWEFGSLDLEGHILVPHFTEEAAKTVDQIKNSTAIDNTRFDQHYLRTWALNVNYLPSSTDFEFLNHMVRRFSDEGSDDMEIPERFLSYTFVKREQVYIETTDKIDPIWQEDQDRIAKEAAMPETLKNKDPDAVRKDLRKLKAAQKETMIQTFLNSIAIAPKEKDQNTENTKLSTQEINTNKPKEPAQKESFLQKIFSLSSS